MSNCPGIEVAKTSPSGKDWYEVRHCPGCQENAQLREQVAQRTAALSLLVTRLDEVHKHAAYAHVWQVAALYDGFYAGPSYEHELTIAKYALADLPDAPKEKP